MPYGSYLPPREGLVSNGSLGQFYRRNIDIVGVYQPTGYEAIQKEGTTILISGANSNHTSLGPVPHSLAAGGQDVKVITIPGYDHDDPKAFLCGNRFHAWDLAQYWVNSVSGAVRILVEEACHKLPEGSLFLGGFSLGAALSLVALSHLKPEYSKKVSGLILGSPSYSYVALEGLFGWLKSSYLAIHAYRGDWRSPKPRPPISDDVKYIDRRPWTSEYAAVRVSKLAQKDLQAFDDPVDNRRVLLIHGGESDETVSQQSSSLVRSTFGYQSVEEHVFSSGHWVFAGNDRDIVKELVLNFVLGKK